MPFLEIVWVRALGQIFHKGDCPKCDMDYYEAILGPPLFKKPTNGGYRGCPICFANNPYAVGLWRQVISRSIDTPRVSV